ncbi:DUF4328 domain-containing protein [Cytophagaceae bacterium DM2B3-1]|uniref:DUF4328 domain-containing protein n=1 Tax=Xanthocytophaga flava TaxID=3048013 RepID=A0ABT7CW49_9BACT|nr:DUF4328 domain-containing protein [Xanthocytophaga flavus]MDJ1498000.1 DUF4328 domain-containing protein [Xanthocytophaga flavus]
MVPILDNTDRARHVVLFFWVYLVVVLAVIGVDSMYLWLLYKAKAGEEISNRLGNLHYWLYSLANLSMFIAFVAVVIVFIQWFRRAYHNIQRGGNYIMNSESAAAWHWFIPIANLFWPYKIMKEIWYETQGTYTSDLKSHGILRIWWILFILSNFRLKAGIYEANPEMIQATMINIGREIITIPAILVTIYVVKQVASFEEQYMQQQKIESLGTTVPLIDNNREEEFY